MTGATDEEAGARIRAEAADWFARMRGPDAASWADGLAAWRDLDPEHDAVYRRLLQRWDQSAFLTNSALGRDRDLGRAATWSRRPFARNVGVAAALLLLTAGIIALTIERTRLSPNRAAAADYASTKGGERVIRLADGSRVTLDAGASVRILKAAGARRAVLLQGRARFDIVPNDARFAVEAAGGSIVSDGGLFDVSLNGQTVKVAAWRGAVDIMARSSSVFQPVRPTRLVALQQLVYVPAGRLPAPTRADPGERGWTDDMISFDRTRLADAVAAINRRNRTQVLLGSSAIGDLRITGAFHGDDPAGFARGAAGLFHLTARVLPDGSILLAPEKKA